MKYKVGCEVYVGNDYEIEADSAEEAEKIAYNTFVAEYELDGFEVITDVEEIEE